MRKNFFLILSILFWILMLIGFSDNFFWDIDQESNSIPKFLVHGFFAFTWFSLLVVQSGMIRKRKTDIHMTLGIAGMIAFGLLVTSTGYLYLTEFLENGRLTNLSKMVFAQFIFGIVLIGIGFTKRMSDLNSHKLYIIFGTFLLIQPIIDRVIGHISTALGVPYLTGVWLLFYLLMFGLFVWYRKKLTWYILAGFLVWASGVVNISINGGG